MGMFEIAHQLDATIMGTAHPQTNGHFAIRGDDWVDVHHLHAAGSTFSRSIMTAVQEKALLAKS